MDIALTPKETILIIVSVAVGFGLGAGAKFVFNLIWKIIERAIFGKEEEEKK
jgi:hypothetical protein